MFIYLSEGRLLMIPTKRSNSLPRVIYAVIIFSYTLLLNFNVNLANNNFKFEAINFLSYEELTFRVVNLHTSANMATQ